MDERENSLQSYLPVAQKGKKKNHVECYHIYRSMPGPSKTPCLFQNKKSTRYVPPWLFSERNWIIKAWSIREGCRHLSGSSRRRLGYLLVGEAGCSKGATTWLNSPKFREGGWYIGYVARRGSMMQQQQSTILKGLSDDERKCVQGSLCRRRPRTTSVGRRMSAAAAAASWRAKWTRVDWAPAYRCSG